MGEGSTSLKAQFETLWAQAGYDKAFGAQLEDQSTLMRTIRPSPAQDKLVITPVLKGHAEPSVDAALLMTQDALSEARRTNIGPPQDNASVGAFQETCDPSPYTGQAPLQDHEQHDRALPKLTLGGRSSSADLELMGELGRGGMGVVRLARQRSLSRDVAIKRIQEHRYNAQTGASLIEEARIAGSLEHPNIIPIHSLGVDDDGRPTLVMKRVQGVSWQRLIRDASHDAWEGLTNDKQRWHIETLIQVCRAIELAHSHRILHRDIKTENIMIGRYGEVYVLDWGIAAPFGAVDDDTFDINSAAPRGPMLGTPAFMAPEMTTGGPFTERTDVYLLGAILHECLTGHARHQGDSLYEVLFNAFASAPARYGPDVHPEIAQIARRATAREPSARYSTAREFREALTHYLLHKDSFDLCDASDLRLHQIQAARRPTGEEYAELQLSYAEARFGYQQALSIWPENLEAQEKLRALRLAMIRFELQCERLGAVEALLKSLDVIPPDLHRDVGELRERRAEEARRLASLESHAHDTNTNVELHRRGLAAMVTSGLMGLLSLGVLYQIHIQRVALKPVMLFAPALVGVIILLIIVTAFKRALNSNKLNQQLSWSIVIFIVTLVMGRATAWGLDVPPLTTLSVELSNGALLIALIALFKDSRIWPAAGTMVLGWAAALMLPEWIPEIYSLVLSVGTAHIGVIWLRAAKEIQGDAPNSDIASKESP